MGSGEAVGQILQVMPLANTTGARYVGDSYGSGGRRYVWSFDRDAENFLDFLVYLHGYDGGGIQCNFFYSCSTNSGSVLWQWGIRRWPDDTVDLDGIHSYSFTGTLDTTPDQIGDLGYKSLTKSDGSTMDNWADQELAIVRLKRDADNVADNAAGEAYVWGFWLEEQ